MSKTWQATVLVEHTKGYQPMPREMRTEAKNYLEAKAYFETFGKVVSTIRIISGGN